MCKITAPEPETRDGLKFSSTDDKGSIATSPDGRILSNVEREAFTTRDEDRPSADLASFSAGSPPPDIDMRQVEPRSPRRDMRMEGFSVTPRGGIKDVMGGFRQGDVTVSEPTGIDLFREMDAQRTRVDSPATVSSFLDRADPARAIGGLGMEQLQARQAKILAGNRQAQMISRRVDNIMANFPDVSTYEAIEIATDEYNKGTLPELISANPSQADMMNTIQEEAGVDPVNIASDAFQFPESQNLGSRYSGRIQSSGEPMPLGQLYYKNVDKMTKDYEDAFAPRMDNRGINEGRIGGNMVGTSSRVPEFTTARSQVGQPNMGVTDSGIRSLNERGRDLQKGFEAAYGVDVPNDPYKAMQARINDPQYQDFLKAQDSIFAGAANRLGKFMGYDDPFELYKATQAQKERNKVADAMRRRDQDRAMQSQAQQPFDPCPPGYKYDPAQRQCVPVAKEEAETEMGQKFVRNPVAFAGDPNMYGRTGGEYQFFTEVPGLIKAANGIPRGPTGEIRGVGGPKDDLVGPFMLSDQEYVLPKEMVMAAGGGIYDTGIKKLENMRKNSLNKYGDYV